MFLDFTRKDAKNSALIEFACNLQVNVWNLHLYVMPTVGSCRRFSGAFRSYKFALKIMIF